MHKIFIILTGYLSGALSYPSCNNIQEQHDYMANERMMFGVEQHKSYFDSEQLFNTTMWIPSSCIREDNTIHSPAVNTCEFIAENTKLERQPPTHRHAWFDHVVWKITDALWRITGWTKIVDNGEHYWYYQNANTANVTFYLHGINVFNGFENIILLRRLTKTSSVYVSVYSPVLFFDPDYTYANNYSEHVNNIAGFIETRLGVNSDIIGNSYGTIRLTTICKRFPSLCDKFVNVVMTDPTNLNLPYSKILDISLYGLLVIHPELTPMYHKSITVNTMRLERNYQQLFRSLDWFEWSIDTEMLRRFSKNMVLVIGDHDELIEINRDSDALKLCRVIYTDLQHGMVIFIDLMSRVRQQTDVYDTVHPVIELPEFDFGNLPSSRP